MGEEPGANRRGVLGGGSVLALAPLAGAIAAAAQAAATASLAQPPGAPPVQPADVCAHWLARHAHVSLTSGAGFAKDGETHLRMNIATSRRTLQAALGSMREVMSALA